MFYLKSATSVSLLSRVCFALENLSVMERLLDLDFNKFFGGMATSRCRDIKWLLSTLPWFPFDFNIGEVFDVPTRDASWVHRWNMNGNTIYYRIVPAFLCSLYYETSLHHQKFRRGCHFGYMSITILRSQVSDRHQKLLRWETYTRMWRLMKVKETEIYLSSLMIWT